MYGVEWIDPIVSPSSNNVDNAAKRRDFTFTPRMHRTKIATKINSKTRTASAVITSATRSLAKCVHKSRRCKARQRSKSLDNIVDNRRRMPWPCSNTSFERLRERINRMEATTTRTTTNANTISDSTKRAISMLVDSKRFVEVVVALSVEVVSVAAGPFEQ